MKTILLLGGLALAAALAPTGAAAAKDAACGLDCARKTLAKPTSQEASLMVMQALMARSLVKRCPNLHVAAASTPVYDYVIANAGKVYGDNLGTMTDYADRRAFEQINEGGCANVPKVLKARFVASLLGLEVQP